MSADLTLTEKVARRVNTEKGNIFLRKDFDGFGGYDQIGRALRALVKRGLLVKVGHGLYARATTSPFDGRPVPAVGIRTLAFEALGRLKIPVSPSTAERDYNAGKTTQVPTGRVVAVSKRVRRKIGYDGHYVKFERERSSAKA